MRSQQTTLETAADPFISIDYAYLKRNSLQCGAKWALTGQVKHFHCLSSNFLRRSTPHDHAHLQHSLFITSLCKKKEKKILLYSVLSSDSINGVNNIQYLSFISFLVLFRIWYQFTQTFAMFSHSFCAELFNFDRRNLSDRNKKKQLINILHVHFVMFLFLTFPLFSLINIFCWLQTKPLDTVYFNFRYVYFLSWFIFYFDFFLLFLIKFVNNVSKMLMLIKFIKCICT